jgi:hypothetical protein
MCRICIAVGIALAGAFAGCDGDGPLPPGSVPSVRVITGADLTDTISTTPSQGLVVLVRGEDGRPDSGVEVRFESPAIGRMEVSGIAQTFFSDFTTAVTDEAGRAVVRVRMSTRAGPAWIAAVVPLYGVQDTARYTVLPGTAVRVELAPRDTTLSMGESFTYRGSTTDRGRNPRTDPVTYEGAGDDALTVEASGRVTGVAIGPARVRARSVVAGVTLVDSVRAMVVPDARIAMSAGTGYGALRISDLSSANQVIADENGLAASWEPGNARFVYVRGTALLIGNAGRKFRRPSDARPGKCHLARMEQ